jgi:competence protein ComEC
LGDVDFWFFNVGQGQSSLIVNHETSEALVVDCGPGAARRVEDRAGDAVLRLVVVTHLDMDHCQELMRIVRGFNPHAVRLNLDTAWPQDKDFRKLNALIRGLKEWAYESSPSRWTYATARDTPSDPSIEGVSWTFLAPEMPDIATAQQSQNRNRASVVMKVTANDSFTALYTGDTDDAVLRRIADQGTETLSADLLVVPHHGGSWQSSSPPLMQLVDLYEAVDPAVAVFSVGAKNRYGHPRPDQLTVPRERGVRVMCTQATVTCHPAISSHAGDPGCAGDVRVRVTPQGYEIWPPARDHRTRIEQWFQPHCLEHDDSVAAMAATSTDATSSSHES